jgi:hypothetical protein
MGKLVLLDVRTFLGAADLSGQSNKLELTDDIEAKETTNYRSGGAKEWLGGLESVTIGAGGQWEAGDPGKVDDQAWASRRVRDVWTMAAESSSDTGVGGIAYIAKALRTSFKLGDAVGEVAPWEASVSGTWPLVRGQFAHPSGVARTTTGSGTAVQVGEVGAGQRLYASLHVLSVAGTSTPTVTVTVQSDDVEAFNSDPQTRLTFAAATEPGGQILRTDGSAIADDDWWRVGWTISGTDPSFLFVAALGIE